MRVLYLPPRTVTELNINNLLATTHLHKLSKIETVTFRVSDTYPTPFLLLSFIPTNSFTNLDSPHSYPHFNVDTDIILSGLKT